MIWNHLSQATVFYLIRLQAEFLIFFINGWSSQRKRYRLDRWIEGFTSWFIEKTLFNIIFCIIQLILYHDWLCELPVNLAMTPYSIPEHNYSETHAFFTLFKNRWFEVSFKRCFSCWRNGVEIISLLQKFRMNAK